MDHLENLFADFLDIDALIQKLNKYSRVLGTFSKSRLYSLIRSGEFPAPHKSGLGRRVFWTNKQIDIYLQKKTVEISKTVGASTLDVIKSASGARSMHQSSAAIHRVPAGGRQMAAGDDDGLI